MNGQYDGWTHQDTQHPVDEAWTCFWRNNFPALLSTCLICFYVSMPLSDCKYESNTQRDHNYSLHSLPMAENCGKRTIFDYRQTNTPEHVDVKWVSLLSLTNLWSISKVKLVSLLLCFTLAFLIMASYILTWDKKRLLFTPSPYQLRPMGVLVSIAAAEVSSEKKSIDMKLLVKIISSKLEYTPRKVPDEKDIIDTDSHVSLYFCSTSTKWLRLLCTFCLKWRKVLYPSVTKIC